MKITLSDVAIYGLNYMFENNMIKKDDIDAILFSSTSIDYFVPPTSNIIQGKLGLKNRYDLP